MMTTRKIIIFPILALLCLLSLPAYGAPKSQSSCSTNDVIAQDLGGGNLVDKNYVIDVNGVFINTGMFIYYFPDHWNGIHWDFHYYIDADGIPVVTNDRGEYIYENGNLAVPVGMRFGISTVWAYTNPYWQVVPWRYVYACDNLTLTPTATPTQPIPPTDTPSLPTNTPRPPTSTPQPQSCTNPPPDRNVGYLFDNENCVNPWNWSSGHPSDSANRNAKSAWMPSGKVLLLSEHNNGSEPTICLQSPVRNLADIGWGNRVEWAALRDSCPVVSGPNHSPGTPQLSSPGNWSEVRTADGPELCWQAVSDPDGDSVQYQVDVFESAVTTNSGWISGTCWRATRLAGQYYGYQWRVKAKDSRGAESGWSERRHFTLSAPAWNPPPPTPTPQPVPTQNPVTGNWWNRDYAYRRPLLITTNGQVAAGTLIKVDNVDIDALVSQGRVRSDHKDLRVVQRLDEQRWQEIARVVYSGWDLEFQLPTALTASTNNTYYIYYGNPTTDAPPTFSLPQGWWVDMHKTKWWDSLAGTWEHNQTMDFEDVCNAPLYHRSRVGTAFDDSDRFRGRLFVPTSGTWTFRVYTNDGYYLKLDGGEVGHDHGYTGNRWATIGSRTLKAGWHRFDAGDMWVNCGAWKLTMAGPNFADQVIPAHFFQKTYDNVKDGVSAGVEEPYLLPTPTATPEPDCGTLRTEAIILFQNRDCHGPSRQFATPSIYNLNDFANLASAVYVPAGWSVRLFSEVNGRGHTYCARESKWNLAIDYYEADGPVIDKSISAIEVFANPDCAPPLQLIEPLSIEPADPVVGEFITAAYAIKNVGSYALYLHGIGVVARGPNCSIGWECALVQDFPVHPTITLAPGESYRYTAMRTYTEVGDGYFAEAAFANRNWWWYPQPNSNRVSFSVNPGLKLVDGLTLSPTEPMVGEALTVRYRLRNESDRPLHFHRLFVAVRGPNCSDWSCPVIRDFPWHNDVTIQPGEDHLYDEHLTFTAPGPGYFAQILHKIGADDWHLLGDRSAFTVAEGLTLVEPLTLSPAQPIAGQPVQAEYELQNNGDRLLVLSSVGVVARGPNCTEDWYCEPNRDFPTVQDLQLAPGQRYVYSQKRTLTESGEGYFAEPSFADGQWWWYSMPSSQRLSFTVQPARETATPSSTITPQPTKTSHPILTVSVTPGPFTPIPTPVDTPTVTTNPTTQAPTQTPIATPTAEGFCTISLGSGALYTNQQSIKIVIDAPDADEVLLANDGGFGDATWQPIQSELTWQLRAPGQHIATLVVQARFRNSQGKSVCSSAAAVDDIIYDPLVPTIAHATYVATDGAAEQRQSSGSGLLYLDATDQVDGSGLANIQISLKPSFSGATWEPYANPTIVDARQGDHLYVQVRDWAGNVSDVKEIVVERQETDFPIIDHVGLISLTIDAQLEGILYWRGTANDPPDGLAAVGADEEMLIVATAENCQAPTDSALGTCHFTFDLRGLPWGLMGFVTVEDGALADGVSHITEEQEVDCLRIVDEIAVSNDSCPFVERSLHQILLPLVSR